MSMNENKLQESTTENIELGEELTVVDPTSKILEFPSAKELFAGRPPTAIIIGMAGSGKTTFVRQIRSEISRKEKKSYVVNLDPAVYELPYTPNIDIRDSVDYKELMLRHKWGPNGAIMGALNLYVTRLEKLEELLIKRSSEVDYNIIDTPGQIEVFTWSASGELITKSISSSFPTVAIYVVDSQRCISNPVTFIASMLYACSILFRLQIPLIIAFNKSDLLKNNEERHTLKRWLTDYDLFSAALREFNENSPDTSYNGQLVDSLAMVLEEFYSLISCVSVSSITGDGFDELIEQIEINSKEYIENFDEKVKLIKKAKEMADERKRQRNMSIFEFMAEKEKSLQKQKKDESNSNCENCDHPCEN